jgi:hypothetical protein
MLFGEIIAVYSETDTKQINTEGKKLRYYYSRWNTVTMGFKGLKIN